jgi:hypothetical protein
LIKRKYRLTPENVNIADKSGLTKNILFKVKIKDSVAHFQMTVDWIGKIYD